MVLRYKLTISQDVDLLMRTIVDDEMSNDK